MQKDFMCISTYGIRQRVAFSFVCVFDFMRNDSSVFLVMNIHLRKFFSLLHFLSFELAKKLVSFFLRFVKFSVKQ